MELEPPPPDFREYATLTVRGLHYSVPWLRMTIGSSVFLPTTAPAEEVQRLLRPFEKRFKMTLAAGTWWQQSCHGVRIWRLG